VRPELVAIALQRVREVGALQERAAQHDRQAQPGGDLQALAGGQHEHRHGAAGVGPNRDLRGALQIAAQLDQVRLEGLRGGRLLPQRAPHGCREPE
jgi:hypothetical protein